MSVFLLCIINAYNVCRGAVSMTLHLHVQTVTSPHLTTKLKTKQNGVFTVNHYFTNVGCLQVNMLALMKLRPLVNVVGNLRSSGRSRRDMATDVSYTLEMAPQT